MKRWSGPQRHVSVDPKEVGPYIRLDLPVAQAGAEQAPQRGKSEAGPIRTASALLWT